MFVLRVNSHSNDHLQVTTAKITTSLYYHVDYTVHNYIEYLKHTTNYIFYAEVTSRFVYKKSKQIRSVEFVHTFGR